MAAVAADRGRLTPSEIEELHIRIATGASLEDPNLNTEGIVSHILSRREDPVPSYNLDTAQTDDIIRQRISWNDHQLWDSVFTVIRKGQVDVLDYFVNLGFNINAHHPIWRQYPIYHAVKFSQANVMRHLINLNADVNSFSHQRLSVILPSIHDTYYPHYDPLRTPLMCAAEQGNLNVCKILCETAFADPMLIAPDGQTAQRLAARNGHKEIVQYLPANRGGSWLRLKRNSLS